MMIRFPVLFLFGLLGTLVALGVVAINLAPSTSSPATALSPTRRYEVRVESERDGSYFHVDFDGGCLVTDESGSSASTSIEGTTPKTFTYTGRSISCSYQKRHSDSFPLRASVLRDGDVVKTVETTATYGTVAFAI
jgi:hypothetical protein